MKTYIALQFGLGYNVDVALRLREEREILPSVWLGNPKLNARVAESFPSTALLDMNQIWRDASHPPDIEGSKFEILGEYWLSPTYRAQRPQLMQELNRWPLPHTVRSIDKEVVLRGLLAATAPSILRSRADFLLASETPHNPINLSVFFFAKWLGIPTLFFQPTSAVAPALLPRTDLGEVHPLAGVTPETSGSHRKVVLARSSLEDLESGVGTMRQRENVRIAEVHSGRAARSRRLISKTVRRFHPKLRDGSPVEGAAFWLRDMQSFFQKELGRSYRSLESGTTLESFALFALHYQPERTIVPESGYGVFSQQDLIVEARRLVPENIPLLIREHKSQVLPTKPGHFGRSALFYRWVQSLPNTQMLSGEGGSRPLLERASVVFTSTGTIGIEASMMGVPAVHFGFPWWQGAPGTTPFSSLDSWDRLLSIRGAGKLEAKSFLSDLIARKTLFGFGTPSQLNFWSRGSLEKSQFESDAAEELFEIVANFADCI